MPQDFIDAHEPDAEGLVTLNTDYTDYLPVRTFATDADVRRDLTMEFLNRGWPANDAVLSEIFALRHEKAHDRPADLTATVKELQARCDLFGFTEGTHFHASFGHLDGYSSAYYTYMWSQVIAKDMFSAFDPADLMDPVVAVRCRDTVLARGGSADAADLVTDFLGRPYTFDAFRAWLDA